MSNWFTVKVKYTKQLDNGGLKRVSEPYLLGAMTFTDAEARIYEELGSIIRGEFQVTGITRTEFQDVFQYEEEDIWYKCKISYEDVDNDSEKAKKVAQKMYLRDKNNLRYLSDVIIFERKNDDKSQASKNLNILIKELKSNTSQALTISNNFNKNEMGAVY